VRGRPVEAARGRGERTKALAVVLLVWPWLAVSDAQSDRTVTDGRTATARSLFLDYVEEPSRELAVKVNPDDLGGNWEKHPVVSWPRGMRVHLWTSGRTQGAVVERVAVDRQSPRGRRIEIQLRSDAIIPKGWVLLTDEALPEQTWTRVAPSATDISMARQLAERRIREIEAALKAARQPLVDRVTYQFFDCSQVRTRLGDFLVVAFGTPEEGEFVTRHTVVFKGSAGTWTRLYEDSDLGHDLLVDIDGDGVPEAVGPTGYNSIALWKIYPKKSLEIMSSSGV
jgi:hypothetical protein